MQVHRARKARGWKPWDIDRWWPTNDYRGSKRSRRAGWLRRLWRKVIGFIQKRRKERRDLTNMRRAGEELRKANKYKLRNLKAQDQSIQLIKQRRKGVR